MSTAIAPAVISKNDQAAQLREKARTLTAELTELRSKLAHASGALAILNDKRQKFVTDAAAGKQPKPGAIATLTAEISDAQIPVEGLTAAVRTKEGQLAQTRSALETLDREIAIEAQHVARNARYQALEKEITDAATLIDDDLRGLIEDHLPAFDAARDALTTEFVGQFAEVTGPEGRAARELIHRLEAGWRDGSFLRTSRKLLRAGWQERGDIVFEIKNLRPPKQ
jgi:chromosome segregation ATPase